MISRSVVPIGTSTRPTLLIWPASAKTFVPALPETVLTQWPFSSRSVTQLPILLYQAAPLRRMTGIEA